MQILTRLFRKEKRTIKVILSREQLNINKKDTNLLNYMAWEFQYEVFGIKASKELVERTTKAITHYVYVVKENYKHKLVGFIRFDVANHQETPSLPNHSLDWLYILPKHRRKGIGKQVVYKIFEYASGFNILFYTIPNSISSDRFFSSFKELKKHNQFYIFN